MLPEYGTVLHRNGRELRTITLLIGRSAGQEDGRCHDERSVQPWLVGLPDWLPGSQLGGSVTFGDIGKAQGAFWAVVDR